MKQARRPSAGRNSKSADDGPVAAQLPDTLPPPPRKFHGRIGTLFSDSQADVPAMPGAPAYAPTSFSSSWTTSDSATPARSAGRSIQGQVRSRLGQAAGLTFENQKKLGVIPRDAELTPRPKEIPAWSQCSSDEKKLYARMQEVFAGFLEHADAQIGKIVEAIERWAARQYADHIPCRRQRSERGRVADLHAQQHEVAEWLSARCRDHPQEERRERRRGARESLPVPWRWAGSSPLKWMKQVASHFGRTPQPDGDELARKPFRLPSVERAMAPDPVRLSSIRLSAFRPL